MSQDYKVVSLASAAAGRQRAEFERGASLPAPLAAVRDRALTFLQVGLSELFDNTDDTLFEKADRASSNADQSLFFDAMRLLRLQRHAVEKSCCDGLERQFGMLQSGPFSSPQSNHSFDVDTLSLVQPDELEQTVALDGMVGRANARNQLPLAHLALRLGTLVGQPMDVRSNPLAPSCLVQLFSDSCAPLGLDIKVRLIILKMFERHVFNSIDSLYVDANGLLKNAGILPDLKQDGLPVRPRGAAAGRPPGGPTGAAEAADPQVLSLFSELISSWRHASGDVALSALGAPSAPPVPSEELLGMLNSFATRQQAEPSATLHDLRGHINRQLGEQLRQTGEVRKLDRVDDDVISLVSMLFDFVLDDAQLPAALKALIGRMQLPILRVAIADKSLFSRSSHPARRLLNELARATLGWSDHDDLRRDQLHSLLERMVDRLLGEQQADAAFFEQMHEELAGFVRIEQRRAERLEQRTRDAEEGRARVDAARSQAARVLNTLLLGRTLPVFVVDLLRDTWSQVLQMAYLREGGNSDLWREAVDTAERLVQSVEPPLGAALEQRPAFNASVCRALCAGLRLIGEEHPEAAPSVAQLQVLQRTVLHRATRLSQPPRPDAASSLEAGVREPVALYETAAATVPEDGIPVLTETVLVDETLLPSPANKEPVELVDELPSAAAIAWVERLHAGSWFELSGIGDQPAQRCKLAAIISFSGKYIFVNRAGMKVAEFTSTTLAHQYERQLIHLLADDQLFDRALESVIGNLRQLRTPRD
ncbi:DUF1631 domain-containing protein [Halopseudomonas bauzanensis]|uniref:DUF1631 domain-containing protein n=1 Tax=Halopseudomonas bauzanensis TaxID=653930 RepID=UPI002554C803|nr:DUF1631 domain-containing protein [Halopseudomonas bauzanensis]